MGWICGQTGREMRMWPLHVVIMEARRCSETSLLLYINKIQRDTTVCRCLFTAKLLFMFRVSIAHIIRSTKKL